MVLEPMNYLPYSNAIETRILSATPLELTLMLFEGAVASVRAARKHLAAGDIAARSRSITKAVDIVTELSQSLNHKAGGELSARLANLYDYMQRLLLEANFKQEDQGLKTVEELLQPLHDAWRQIVAADTQQAEPELVSAGRYRQMA